MNVGTIIRAVVGFFVVLAAVLILVVQAATLFGALNDIEKFRDEIGQNTTDLEVAEERRNPKLRDEKAIVASLETCEEDLQSLREDHPEAAARVREEIGRDSE